MKLLMKRLLITYSFSETGFKNIKMEVQDMSEYLPSFTSFYDFIKRLINIFKGPMFITVFRKIDPAFREKILLTVSMSNNCAG